MTGDSACRGIRDHDADGTIGLFGAESHEPYARPPLSKALWAGKDEDSIFRGTADLGVDVHAGRRIVGLDLDASTATDDAGETHSYDKLLLATGGHPRRLPFGRRRHLLPHARRLPPAPRAGRRRARVAVIGGGFIGSEIAAALATSGCAVTIVFPEAGIGARLFPADLSASSTTTTARRVSRSWPKSSSRRSRPVPSRPVDGTVHRGGRGRGRARDRPEHPARRARRAGGRQRHPGRRVRAGRRA